MSDDVERTARRSALTALERQMRRARFAEHLPEEERQQITIILGHGRAPKNPETGEREDAPTMDEDETTNED
jgi:hypothetical protein